MMLFKCYEKEAYKLQLSYRTLDIEWDPGYLKESECHKWLYIEYSANSAYEYFVLTSKFIKVVGKASQAQLLLYDAYWKRNFFNIYFLQSSAWRLLKFCLVYGE